MGDPSEVKMERAQQASVRGMSAAVSRCATGTQSRRGAMSDGTRVHAQSLITSLSPSPRQSAHVFCSTRLLYRSPRSPLSHPLESAVSLFVVAVLVAERRRCTVTDSLLANSLVK